MMKKKETIKCKRKVQKTKLTKTNKTQNNVKCYYNCGSTLSLCHHTPFSKMAANKLFAC